MVVVQKMSGGGGGGEDDPARFKIGYALAEKKQRSFVQASLVDHARSRGIDLLGIDPGKALVEQGPFDAILHKLSGKSWYRQLQEYEEHNPGVIIIDSPAAIERLHNRVSMLQAVSDLRHRLRSATDGETFGIPKQAVVERGESLSDCRAMTGLKFPVIAKPLVADGSAKSHAMSLVFNREGLTNLKTPVVLQEFVNHGGVIFKVYVVGEYVKCVTRRSLPDVSEEEEAEKRSEAPPMVFSQISNMGSTHEQPDYLLQAELPPAKLVSELAKGLRENLGLRLFNFDLIRDVKAGTHYHVIDINYFPGYAKMPAYESVLTDFFLGLAKVKANSTPVAN